MTVFKLKRYEEAVKLFTKAVAKHPTSVHHNNLGLAYYHINNLIEALRHFDKALEFDSKDPNIYFNRGNVYLN